MMKARSNSLFSLVHDYLKIYLPKQRNVSPNTRFAAIRAFMDYAADHDLALVANLNKLKKVPFKKPDNPTVVDYMSMAAITAIIEQPDTSTPKGLRDQFFMILLYDTGARVQEILNIKLCDLQLGRLPKVTLFGKGRKTRVVPLMERTVLHLKKYLLVFHADSVSTADLPLFYSVSYGEKHPLTTRMAQYILQKYGEQARCVCQEVPEKVHPHIFRHSRAMHLYQEGMDLTLVSQWLGHSQLETTQIYYGKKNLMTS